MVAIVEVEVSTDFAAVVDVVGWSAVVVVEGGVVVGGSVLVVAVTMVELVVVVAEVGAEALVGTSVVETTDESTNCRAVATSSSAGAVLALTAPARAMRATRPLGMRMRFLCHHCRCGDRDGGCRPP